MRRVAGFASPRARVAASVRNGVMLKTVKTFSTTMSRTRRPLGGGAALTSPRARRSATSASVRPVSEVRPDLRLREEDRAHEPLGRGVGVVRVDGDRYGGRINRDVAVDLLEIVDHVTPLGHPLAELGGAGAQHDVGDGAGLLALADRADWLRGVPHVADDLRAHRLRNARPHDEDLPGLVVSGLVAGVRALGQHGDLPLPLEDGCLLEVDLALDLLGDGRALVDALHVERLAPVVADDREVVLRAAPVLALPSLGDALGADGLLAPVLDEENAALGPRGGGEGQAEGNEREACGHEVTPRSTIGAGRGRRAWAL